MWLCNQMAPPRATGGNAAGATTHRANASTHAVTPKRMALPGGDSPPSALRLSLPVLSCSSSQGVACPISFPATGILAHHVDPVIGQDEPAQAVTVGVQGRLQATVLLERGERCAFGSDLLGVSASQAASAPLLDQLPQMHVHASWSSASMNKSSIAEAT